MNEGASGGRSLLLKMSVVISCFQGLIPIFGFNFKGKKTDYPACVKEDACKVVSIILGVFSTITRRFGNGNLTSRALSYQQLEAGGCL
jgi:hypothetical protein